MTQIIPLPPDSFGFVPENASRAARSRLLQFLEWLAETGGHLLNPDFAAYALYLEHERGLTPTSAAAYLNTVRARYRKQILKNNGVRDYLSHAAYNAGYADPANVAALVNEQLARLENALTEVKVKAARQTMKTDEQLGRWLSEDEIAELLSMPDPYTLEGMRDRAIFTLMLHTGIRAAEQCNVRVRDVYQTVKGHKGLNVTEGKGARQRFVPYGANAYIVFDAVEVWLEASGIKHGFLFRGIKAQAAAKKRHLPGDLRSTRMGTRTLGYIFDRYPVRGEALNPHDTRRTYAGRLYELGVPLPDIQRLLGHASYETTLRYLGLDREPVIPPALLQKPKTQVDEDGTRRVWSEEEGRYIEQKGLL